MRAVESELKATEAQLAKKIDTKTAELQRKYEEYVKTVDTMLPPVKASTEREMEILSRSLEQLKLDAQAAYEKKFQDLMTPIYSKLGDAIEAVGKENGYTFILSAAIAGQDVLLFAHEDTDVSDLILQKLGIVSTASSENPD